MICNIHNTVEEVSSWVKTHIMATNTQDENSSVWVDSASVPRIHTIMMHQLSRTLNKLRSHMPCILVMHRSFWCNKLFAYTIYCSDETLTVIFTFVCNSTICWWQFKMEMSVQIQRNILHYCFNSREFLELLRIKWNRFGLFPFLLTTVKRKKRKKKWK